MLLRVKYVKGWRLERVATMYRVSRATAARMVAAARDALSAETRRLLRERLALTPSELESLVQLLQSQLEVSLVRLLGTQDPGEEGDLFPFPSPFAYSRISRQPAPTPWSPRCAAARARPSSSPAPPV
jgi:hypothetical protein